MRISIFFSFVVCLLFTSNSFAKKGIEMGPWQGRLELETSVYLPFNMILEKGEGGIPKIQIQNAAERINLIFKMKDGDTLCYDFPQFDSQIRFVFNENNSFNGYWWNKNKKGTYQIPLTGHKCKNDLFECLKTYGSDDSFLAKKWKTTFAPNTKDSWPAIGLFEKDQEEVTGTFLTETGDYRFLQGNMYGNSLFLSCFDGSHAFLFTAELIDEKLYGKFYSGKHYSCDWIAEEDEEFELPHPDELTFVVNDNPLKFELPNLDGTLFTYPNPKFKNKVTIIQIMGSWCPNCVDETKYYLDLYKKYHDKGLEIILIGYEIGANETDYTMKLQKFKERNNIPFTMLIGGAANKNKATQDFSMLNHIISFPTSIFVNGKREIIKVHTGFNGPSTGEYYSEYMKETELFMQNLLDQ